MKPLESLWRYEQLRMLAAAATAARGGMIVLVTKMMEDLVCSDSFASFFALLSRTRTKMRTSHLGVAETLLRNNTTLVPIWR